MTDSPASVINVVAPASAITAMAKSIGADGIDRHHDGAGPNHTVHGDEGVDRLREANRDAISASDAGRHE